MQVIGTGLQPPSTGHARIGALPNGPARPPGEREGTPGEREPLYARVYATLRSALVEGRWAVGASLPSEADLSAQFRVSRITIRHALRLLESEGFIRKERARRAIVVATGPAPRPGWTLESIDDIIAMVGNARLAVQTWRREAAPDEASLFGLPPSTKLHCLRSVLVRNERAYSRSTIFFPPALGSRLSLNAFDDPVVFRVLQRELGIGIEDVRLTIWAELADAQDAASLRCEAGSALLVMQLIYRGGDGALVEIAYSRTLASDVRLSTRLRTDRPRS